jgi:DNA-binding transcriptional LysR family regulator
LERSQTGVAEIPTVKNDIGLRHLKALRLLLEVRSLTRAAEILDLNQPTVSKMLARLRSYFEDPLFVRVGLTMEPTPRALGLVHPLRSLLAFSDDIKTSKSSFDPATSEREFKVLVSEVGMVHLVPPLMRDLEISGRRLRLRAVPLDSRHVSAKLESGDADVALGAFPREIGKLRRQKLYTDPYISVVRTGHPRLDRLTRMDTFLHERHILVTASATGHAAHEQLEKALLERLPPESVQVRVPSFVSSAFVVSQSDAICTMPKRLASYLIRKLPLQMFKPPLQLPRIEIAQVWHERLNQDAGHRWLRSRVFNLFRASSNAEGPS